MGKGENAGYIIFFSCLYHTSPTLNDPFERPFENIEGKEETAGNQHNVFYSSQNKAPL